MSSAQTEQDRGDLPTSPLAAWFDDARGGEGSVPLCVGLEGALLVVDLASERRLRVFASPRSVLKLARGRAALDAHLRERVRLSATELPYRVDVVDTLRRLHATGRELVLLGAGDPALLDAITRHLGLFHRTLVVPEGADVDSVLREAFPRGFDFIGGHRLDGPVLRAANNAYLVAADDSVLREVRASRGVAREIVRRPSLLRAIIKEIRPYQWAKNALVFVPVALAPGLPSVEQLVAAALAMLSFSLCASGGYVFNDLLDVRADRLHHTKQQRPFASGALPIEAGPLLFALLMGTSFVVSVAFLPIGFSAMLLAYFCATLAYSARLKEILIVDVLTLAWLYTHRVLAGGIATDDIVSPWLLAFSLFVFLSLAFCKRFIELIVHTGKERQLDRRGYHTADIQMVASMGPAAGYMAVLVLCLYLESDAVTATYARPAGLWLVVPVLLYWISRIWLLANRGRLPDDPIRFALKDPVSLISVGVIAVIAAVARWS